MLQHYYSIHNRIECLAVVVTDSKEDIVVSAVSVIHPDSIDVVARDEDLRVTRDSSVVTEVNKRIECLAVVVTDSKEDIVVSAVSVIHPDSIDVIARDEDLGVTQQFSALLPEVNKRIECLAVVVTDSKKISLSPPLVLSTQTA